ncbi:hypothetical protein [Aliikangiella maris]|uniref:Uncharacterized protein n=2 Tax=Aliikangiella maris TaxID=3162458 RepID=A0ABV2BSV6_9GAMM
MTTKSVKPIAPSKKGTTTIGGDGLIKQLYDKLLANVTGTTLNLIPGAISNGNIVTYLNMLVANSLKIDNVVIVLAKDESKISIAGTSSAFGFESKINSLCFTLQNNQYLMDLDASISSGTWELDGVNWFAISQPGFTIQASDDGTVNSASMNGIIDAGKTLAVTASFPGSGQQFILTGSFAENYPNIANFFSLLGGVNIVGTMPAPFNTFDDIGLQNIGIIYDLQNKNLSQINVTLAADPDKTWNPIPQLTVTGLEFFATVNNPGNTQSRSTAIVITGNFSIGKASQNNLQISVYLPTFSATATLSEGTVQLTDLVNVFLPGFSIDLKSEISALNIDIAPAEKNYDLSCQIETDWQFININNSLIFTLTQIKMAASRQQGLNKATLAGLFHIGPQSGGLDLSCGVNYQGTEEGWQFGASTLPDQQIELIPLLNSVFKALTVPLPSFVSNGGSALSISNILFQATIPPSISSVKKSYRVIGTTDWQLVYQSFSASLQATVDVTYQNETFNGKISGVVDLLGLTFQAGYVFDTAAGSKELYLQWKQIRADYTEDSKQSVITLTIQNETLGGMLSSLIQSIDRNFKLSSPWSLLNSIHLDNLSLKYIKQKSDSSVKFELVYAGKIDLGFLNIDNITLTKDSGGVFLGFEGQFLGLTITADDPTTQALAGKGSNVQQMPAVPGMGSQFFDLKFLGMGQHIQLASSQNIDSISQAIDDMSGAFKDTNNQPNTIPVKASGGALIFNQNSNWLIGANFVVAKFYNLAFVFNDPNLYGLLISISKDAKFLANLQFEILYKKINDSIGVYQIELQLPEAYRQLEFGEVSITLPNIGFKIYTNGNFYIDIGWPKSISDFSRSFTVQVFPFLGSGGFYFGYLSGATATNLPATGNRGVFNPVIEAGIALNLGVGKTINKGILSAGLSLTAVGIFQGTFATYTPNPNLPAPLNKEIDHYYKFQGTLALVGRIYGQVNFAIISASFDITAYISATLVVESYMSIPISFEAGVSVSLSVRINLGLFKITIHLSFHTTIQAAFTIGHDHPQDSLWYKASHLSSKAFLMNFAEPDLASEPVMLNWQPITIDDSNISYGLDLYFSPHLTISGESYNGLNKGAQYVGMLYLNTGSNVFNNTEYGMTAIAKGVLYWVINAVIGAQQANTTLSWIQSQTITDDQLKLLLTYFETRPDNEAPFNYLNQNNHDIQNFLKQFFSISITSVNDAQSQDLSASVFPIFPELQMQTEFNQTKGPLINFATQSMTGNTGYIATLSNILANLAVDYESQLTANYYANSGDIPIKNPDYQQQPDLSMPTVILTDFVALIAKQVLQTAIDYLTAKGEATSTVKALVDGAITTENSQQLSGMASRFMLHGMRLPVPPDANTGELQPLYVLTGQQIAIPDSIKTSDQYQLNLINSQADWIKLTNATNNQLSVTIDSNEIQRIIDTATIKLAPSIQASYPKAINNCNITPQNFSLGGEAIWNYPGELVSGSNNSPIIWKMPPNFIDAMNENMGQAIQVDLQTLTRQGDKTIRGKVTNLLWSTNISVNVRRLSAQDLTNTPLSANIYDLIGANDASIDLLEKMLSYINLLTARGTNVNQRFFKQIQFLMKPDPTQGQAGYVSSENGQLSSAIIKANLSTETNPPPPSMLLLAVSEESSEPQFNTLNSPAEFITQLWECSIVRSGGFYFYYETDDNKGLPDYLFNENGIAEVQIVITLQDFVAQPFINSVVTLDKLDPSKTAVFAQSPEITIPVPTIPTGSVGYELVRENPGDYNPQSLPPSKEEDQIYLQNQFNLLGISLPSVEVYKNYLPDGPTNPMTDEEIAKSQAGEEPTGDPQGPWNYSAVIPYYKFIQTEQSYSGFPNPYLGIGKTVEMQLNWQDMFGNIPDNDVAYVPVSMDILYTDQLIALSQWPSLSSYYLFETNPTTNLPQVVINFYFTTSRYDTGDAGAINQAKIDLQTYIQLAYQLQSSSINMYFQSSIDGSQKSPEGSQRQIDINQLLTQLIKPIITYLQTIADGQAAPNPSGIPSPYQITDDVTPTSIASYADSIPLNVSLSLQRTDNIDPQFADAPGVSSAQTLLKPQSQSKPASNGANQAQTANQLSLTAFASEFENAFKDQPTAGIQLKVATASDLSSNGSQNTHPLWFVRFDSQGQSGIRYTFDNSQVYFCSPIPLATSLISLTTTVQSYQTGQPFPVDGAEVKKSFSNIDLENWGKQFLEAVDNLLAPGFAVPLFLLNNGEQLKQILNDKEALAEAIEGTIDFIITPAQSTAANIENAQEKWKQQMLIQLSNAYRYTTSVQTPTTICSSWQGSNNEPPQSPYIPRLYGNMMGEDPAVSQSDASTEYSLSTAKLPMAQGDSWLTYLFEAKDTPEYRKFDFSNMQYQVSHLEQQIETVAGIEGYLASTWLTFVIPLAPSMGNVGKVSIPVPLRSYPTPPSVTAQNAIYPTVSPITTLTEARQWNFGYNYVNSVAAQDSIELKVELNVPENYQSPHQKSVSSLSALDQQLAQFVSVYPAIEKDLQIYLTQLTAKDVKDQTTIYTNARFAVEAFSSIISSVATAWGQWNQVNPRKKSMLAEGLQMQANEGPVELNYQVSEVQSATSPNLQIQVTPIGNNPMSIMPQVQINGYQTKPVSDLANTWQYFNPQTQRYLTYADRNKNPNRQVIFEDFDILNLQNAWGGALITRNLELLPATSGSGWQPTNKHFIYQTPLVKFYTKLLTLLNSNTTLNIAEIGTKNYPAKSGRSLQDNMSALFDALSETVDFSTLMIKLHCEYTYLIPDTSLPITVPVLLVTPTDLTISDRGQSFASEVSSTLTDWLSSNIPGHPNGRFNFGLDVFSNLDENRVIFQQKFQLECDF